MFEVVMFKYSYFLHFIQLFKLNSLQLGSEDRNEEYSEVGRASIVFSSQTADMSKLPLSSSAAEMASLFL